MRIVFFLLFSVLSVLPVFGADSTSFDPTRVAVTAKGSGVPVGTIIAWPVATNPDDMDNWLECNGQSVNPSVYPELSAVVGSTVPDLRGLFLRGYGEQDFVQNNGSTVGVTNTIYQSGELGQIQGDATRMFTAKFGNYTLHEPVAAHDGIAFYSPISTHGGASDSFSRWYGITNLDASRMVPTANEIRPVNRAVRYLMRARP